MTLHLVSQNQACGRRGDPMCRSCRECVAAATPGTIAVFLDGLALPSLNASLRGTTKGARFAAITKARQTRQRVRTTLLAKFPNGPNLRYPITVTVTRVAPGRGLDRHDNLPAACKHVVDGVADYIGLDDCDPRINWHYAQRRDGRTVGVLIEISGESAEPNPSPPPVPPMAA
jgi:hypothetical protein